MHESAQGLHASAQIIFNLASMEMWLSLKEMVHGNVTTIHQSPSLKPTLILMLLALFAFSLPLARPVLCFQVVLFPQAPCACIFGVLFPFHKFSFHHHVFVCILFSSFLCWSIILMHMMPLFFFWGSVWLQILSCGRSVS